MWLVNETEPLTKHRDCKAGTAGGERVKEEDVKSARADSYKGTKEVAVAITSKVVHSDWGGGYQVSPSVVWLVNWTESLTRHRL
jgi:hypothetical protein